MNNAKKTCLVASVVLIVLTFSAFLHHHQADAQEHRAPASFTKLTPIDLSAFQSVWAITLDWDDSVGATQYEYCFDKTNIIDSFISTY